MSRITDPLLALWLTVFPVLLWAETGAFDVVTMRNGEIHNGRLAQSLFRLQTGYAELTIPYERMLSLHIGDGDMPDRILTRQGEHISGELLELELNMQRTLDPPLPLPVARISEIIFGARGVDRQDPEADWLVTAAGDTLAGRLLTSDLMLMGSAGLQMIGRESIAYLGLIPGAEVGAVHAEIVQRDGTLQQGRLMNRRLLVRSAYQPSLELAPEQLDALAPAPVPVNALVPYLLRGRLDPERLLVDRMRDGTAGPPLARLPGGGLLRGDLQGDGDGDEQPPTRLQLKPFAIGLHEVTFREYDRFCRETGRELPDDQGWGRGLRPVVNVTWEDAQAFSRWLSERTGEQYRLPTDAEWEYAARAGRESRYWWGDELISAMANCAGCGSLWDSERSAPVGRFPPNPFGLHDTAGNVFEWVEDCWNDSYAEAPGDGSALETRGCGKRVIRGGAWSFPPHEIRSANRWRDFPARSSDDTGFRVVRELTRDEAPALTASDGDPSLRNPPSPPRHP